MKILLIAKQTETSDGWGTLARTTAVGLAERGHTVEILCQKNDPLLAITQHAELPSPLLLISNPFTLPFVAWQIWRRIRAFRPDIIHVLTEPYALAFPFIPRASRHPWVLTGCGTYTILPLAKRPLMRILRAVYKDVDHVLAISHYTKKRILEAVRGYSHGFSEALGRKISVYTLGIEPVEHVPAPTARTEKRILFVGEVKPRKGILEIIEACGKFKQRSEVPFRLDVAGMFSKNEYTSLLKDRVAALGLEQEVCFRGRVSEEELAQLYADADLFMMLSFPCGVHFEGYGLVFLEANARGVPVIGPNDSGCIDAIADGRSGFTVDPKNPDAVAEKMEQVLLRNAIDSDACRAWAKEHSVARQAEETEVLYRKALNRV